MINPKATTFLSMLLTNSHAHIFGSMALFGSRHEIEKQGEFSKATFRSATYMIEEIKNSGVMTIKSGKYGVIGNDAIVELYELFRHELYHRYNERNVGVMIGEILERIGYQMDLTIPD